MNCFEQRELLGVDVKGQGPRGSRSPQIVSPFIENELSFDGEYIPGLDTLVGNTSNLLRTAMVLITGKLTVSHSYQRIVAQKAGDFELNRRLVNIATEDENIFQEIPGAKILKGDGQVCDGSLYQINPERNGNILASSLAFVDAFRSISSNSLKQWGAITGLKTIEEENTLNALEIIKFFGDNPDAQFPVNIGEGDSKETNPMYQALRKMREANGFIEFTSNPSITVRKKNNAKIPALQAVIQDNYKPMAIEFRERIQHYEKCLGCYMKNGLGNIFDTNPAIGYGIVPERNEKISQALEIYKNLSLSPQSK